MRNIITPDVLKTMIPQEFEDWREAGEDLRRELTHAVMRDLTCPADWDMNGEYRMSSVAFFLYRFASRRHTATSISPYAVPATSPRHGWWCSFLPAVARFLLSAPCLPGRRRLFLTHSA